MSTDAHQELAEKLRAMRERDREGAGAPRYAGLDDLPAMNYFRAGAWMREGQMELPFQRVRWEGNGVRRVIDGRPCVTFSSYDYLGLAGHAEVAEAVSATVARHGTSVSASRLASGAIREHLELEAELAAMLGVESALVMISGYGTNVALLGHLTDPRTLVLHDESIHNSILTGIRLSGARPEAFAHNDLEDLEQRLVRWRDRYHRLLIVVEGVYSMEGDLPDLPRLLALKKRYGGALMVDEAHSLGVLGQRGFGIGEHCGLVSRDAVEVWMGTLSKSLASSGGFVAGSRTLIDYLRWSAPGHLFSVGLSPPATAAALTALRIQRREPERVERLRGLASFFREYAHARGVTVLAGRGEAGGHGAILPVMIGEADRAVALSAALFREGIEVQPVVQPVVPTGTARLRFFVTASHTREEIARAVDHLSLLMA